MAEFIDIGCKDGRSFPLAARFGYFDGVGIDNNPDHVAKARENGLPIVLGNALDLDFPDKSFKMSILNHVIEHLPDREAGWKAIKEMIRVTEKTILIGLPYFDAEPYLNGIGLKTFYSDWSGHPNMVRLEELKEFIIGLGLWPEVNFIKPIYNSSATEIHSLSSPRNQHDYVEGLHPIKPFIEFDREIWREYQIIIHL